MLRALTKGLDLTDARFMFHPIKDDDIAKRRDPLRIRRAGRGAIDGVQVEHGEVVGGGEGVLQNLQGQFPDSGGVPLGGKSTHGTCLPMKLMKTIPANPCARTQPVIDECFGRFLLFRNLCEMRNFC